MYYNEMSCRQFSCCFALWQIQRLISTDRRRCWMKNQSCEKENNWMEVLQYQSSTAGRIVSSVHLMFDVRPVNGEAWLVNAVDHFHPGGGAGGVVRLSGG